MIRARIVASYTYYSLFVTKLAADICLARLNTDITKPASNLSITRWLEWGYVKFSVYGKADTLSLVRNSAKEIISGLLSH
jgi:hypothetical protein